MQRITESPYAKRIYEKAWHDLDHRELPENAEEVILKSEAISSIPIPEACPEDVGEDEEETSPSKGLTKTNDEED